MIHCCYCGHIQFSQHDKIMICCHCKGISDIRTLWNNESRRIAFYKLDTLCFPYQKENGIAVYNGEHLEHDLEMLNILNKIHKEL